MGFDQWVDGVVWLIGCPPASTGGATHTNRTIKAPPSYHGQFWRREAVTGSCVHVRCTVCSGLWPLCREAAIATYVVRFALSVCAVKQPLPRNLRTRTLYGLLCAVKQPLPRTLRTRTLYGLLCAVKQPLSRTLRSPLWLLHACVRMRVSCACVCACACIMRMRVCVCVYHVHACVRVGVSCACVCACIMCVYHVRACVCACGCIMCVCVCACGCIMYVRVYVLFGELVGLVLAVAVACCAYL